MQAVALQVNRLAASNVVPVAAAPVGPLQSPLNDLLLRYMHAHDTATPMPAGLDGPWLGTEPAPLRPLGRKDVDKPGKYGGSDDDWLQYSRTFQQFLDRNDSPYNRWSAVLKKIEGQKGQTISKAMGEAWAVEFWLGEITLWK